MMEGVLGGGSDYADSWNRRAKGSGKGENHAAVLPMHAATAPVFLPSMAVVQHELALSFIGIPKNCDDVRTFAGQIPQARMPFGTWWMEIGKTKNLEPWKRKCKSLRASDGQLENRDTAGIGALLYQHLDRNGEWSEIPMQAAPAAM